MAPLIYGSLRKVRPGPLKGDNPTRAVWLLGGIGLALNVTGAYAYSFALGEGSASLVVPISSSYPLITIVIAVALLRERLVKFHFAALGVVVVGLVMIGLTL